MDPNFVWENRKFTVVETEDEIPFWVVRGDRKKVVSKKAHQALRSAINANRRLKKTGEALAEDASGNHLASNGKVGSRPPARNPGGQECDPPLLRRGQGAERRGAAE